MLGSWLCKCAGSGLLDLLVHLIDLLLDDRILSLHGVLDDLGLFHLHCVDVVQVMLVMHSHNSFNGSLLDPALRYTIFGWSLRVRSVLRGFENP